MYYCVDCRVHQEVERPTHPTWLRKSSPQGIFAVISTHMHTGAVVKRCSPSYNSIHSADMLHG